MREIEIYKVTPPAIFLRPWGKDEYIDECIQKFDKKDAKFIKNNENEWIYRIVWSKIPEFIKILGVSGFDVYNIAEIYYRHDIKKDLK